MRNRTALDRALWEAEITNRALAGRLKTHETQVSRWRKGLHLPEQKTQESIASIVGDALGRSVLPTELWPADQDSKAAAA